MIAAIIVTFFPDEKKLNRVIESIVNQVDYVVIVDNGSDAIFSIMSHYEDGFFWITNIENYGIAKALNQGIKFAGTLGAKWVITLDQDSECASNIISEYKKYINEDKIGVLCPVEIERNCKVYMNIGKPLQEIEKAITSGSFINMDIFEKTGGFQEELFIDYVDYDFCEKVRRKGYKICRVNTTTIVQESGQSSMKELLGYKVRVGNYGYKRKYFLYRNWHYYIRKYNKGYLEYLKMLKSVMKSLMFESMRDNRAIARGFIDTYSFEKKLREKNDESDGVISNL